MVPDGHRAAARVGRQIGRQVGLEPGQLGGAGTAAADERAVRIEHDHVPHRGRIRVPAPRSGPRGLAEVGEVRRAVVGDHVVIADRRPGPVPERAPGRIVAAEELGGRPGLVGVVARGEHPARDPGQELGGLGGVRGRAAGDVARPDEHGIRTGRHRGAEAVPEPRRSQGSRPSPGRWDRRRRAGCAGSRLTASARKAVSATRTRTTKRHARDDRPPARPPTARAGRRRSGLGRPGVHRRFDGRAVGRVTRDRRIDRPLIG